jgi:hypothetical protein
LCWRPRTGCGKLLLFCGWRRSIGRFDIYIEKWWKVSAKYNGEQNAVWALRTI